MRWALMSTTDVRFLPFITHLHLSSSMYSVWVQNRVCRRRSHWDIAFKTTLMSAQSWLYRNPSIKEHTAGTGMLESVISQSCLSLSRSRGRGLRRRDKVRQDKINAGGMQSIPLCTSLNLEAQTQTETVVKHLSEMVCRHAASSDD